LLNICIFYTVPIFYYITLFLVQMITYSNLNGVGTSPLLFTLAWCHIYFYPGLGRCAPGEFECPSGDCMPAASKCDGTQQCSDGYDEFLCPTTQSCKIDQYRYVCCLYCMYCILRVI